MNKCYMIAFALRITQVGTVTENCRSDSSHLKLTFCMQMCVTEEAGTLVATVKEFDLHLPTSPNDLQQPC